jgi:hypothetical protein
MKRAAETTCWFAFGGDRDDWIVPGWAPTNPEWIRLWLADWAAYYRSRRT